MRPDHERGLRRSLAERPLPPRRANYSTTATVVLVIGFNLVMLWLLEVPLACFVVAPDWTPRAVDRAKAWVSRHSHMFAVRGLTLLGVLLIIKGIVGLT